MDNKGIQSSLSNALAALSSTQLHPEDLGYPNDLSQHNIQWGNEYKWGNEYNCVQENEENGLESIQGIQ